MGPAFIVARLGGARRLHRLARRRTAPLPAENEPRRLCRLCPRPERGAVRHLLAEGRAAAVALGQVARGTAGVATGLVAWLLIATAGNLLLRLSWPAYAAVEKAMSFTFGMLTARLVLGAVSSLGAGFPVAWITRRNAVAAWCLVALLLAIFIPVHSSLWPRVPAWYHALFVAS